MLSATPLLRRSALSWAAPLAARAVHTPAALASPQVGGYMQTGQEVQDHPLRFLVTGAGGQIGQELVPFLRNKFGVDQVIASDIKSSRDMSSQGQFVYCDVTDADSLARVVLEHGVNYVVHLASLLSAIGERNPLLALKVNTRGVQNVLELARVHDLKVFAPSTIAVFGANTPRTNTPDDTIMSPSTVYGITKIHQELMGSYYHDKYGVDYRSLRYPGVISARAMPGGGTTDYAVEIFHKAVTHKSYKCFLAKDAALPMMYMDDAIKATIQLMLAPRESLKRNTYNVTSMSFSPEQLANAIRKQVPDFDVVYQPDFRNEIAETWPISIDDSAAREDWGWHPDFDLDAMTSDMLRILGERYAQADE